MIRYLVGDVHEQLATLEDESVDLVVTSPPFLALRSYLPADHPDKGKEIGSEATPADFIDTLLRVTQELRRVLAPHGSIAIELGDTFAGSGGAGGDYNPGGFREEQPGFRGSGRTPSGRIVDTNEKYERVRGDGYRQGLPNLNGKTQGGGPSWPLAKSRALIPELYRIALAYGINPLTGIESPAGRWRVRNVVTWCRPNPPVGALGDKWRPATSDIVVACTSGKRYWDDLATRKETNDSHATSRASLNRSSGGYHTGDDTDTAAPISDVSRGAPLLDYWVIPPTGYKGAHYAVYPPEIVVPLVKAMCPERVCRTCREPSRRITSVPQYVSDKTGQTVEKRQWLNGERQTQGAIGVDTGVQRSVETVGWSDCGHDSWRPGLVLDPFAGSGTTLMVAHGHGRDTIGIDLDERNLDLTRERIGPMFEIGVTA